MRRVSLSDLLLILIVVLLGLRLIVPLALGFMVPNAFAQRPGSPLGGLAAAILLQNALLLGGVYLIVVLRRGVSWSALGFIASPPGWSGRAALLALLAVPGVAIINALVQSITGETLRNPQIEALSPVGFSWTAYLSILLLAGILVPFTEEVVFRGLLYGWLRERLGVGVAMLLGSVIFAVVHGIPALIPVLIGVGLLITWVYERSGSIWPAIILHATFNSVMTTLLYIALARGIPLG